MLAKLESVYLGILRVVILIIATLALVAAVLGAVTSLPSLMAAGGLGAKEPNGGTLAEWVDEQKARGASPADEGNPEAQGDGAAADPAVLPDIAEAARNVETYLGKDALNRRDLSNALQASADEIGRTMPQGDIKYAASLRGLTVELLASKGRKLSPERVGRLLQWHHEHFAANVAADEARKAEAKAGLVMQLGIAGGAFVAFVLVIFVFLFVKIERNLRRPSPDNAQVVNVSDAA